MRPRVVLALARATQSLRLQLTNVAATDLSALAGAMRFGELQLWGVPLVDFRSLESVALGGLSVRNMPALVSLEGAEGIEPTLSRLIVSDNPVLVDFTGLEGVEAVDGYFSVRDNPSLESFHGLEQLRSIASNAVIRDNDAFTDMTGLDGLEHVGGDLTIVANASLTSLAGLESLGFVGEDLWIRENQVENVANLESLETVIGSLVISEAELTSMDGLDALRSVGSLSQSGSRWLTDPGTYPALESIGNLSIWNNLQLPHCKVTALVTLHNTNCDVCYGNKLNSPECVVSRDAMPSLGMATHRDYGGWGVFDDFQPNPEFPEMKVERDAGGNTLEMARTTMEFEFPVPNGAAIMSAMLALPTHAIIWDQVSRFDLVLYLYDADGTMTMGSTYASSKNGIRIRSSNRYRSTISPPRPSIDPH